MQTTNKRASTVPGDLLTAVPVYFIFGFLALIFMVVVILIAPGQDADDAIISKSYHVDFIANVEALLKEPVESYGDLYSIVKNAEGADKNAAQIFKKKLIDFSKNDFYFSGRKYELAWARVYYYDETESYFYKTRIPTEEFEVSPPDSYTSDCHSERKQAYVYYHFIPNNKKLVLCFMEVS